MKCESTRLARWPRGLVQLIHEFLLPRFLLEPQFFGVNVSLSLAMKKNTVETVSNTWYYKNHRSS